MSIQIDTDIVKRRRYEAVNASWPAVVPPLTGPEAVTAAKRLYRFGLGRAYLGTVRLTSGNRRTWTRGGVLWVNPDRGWRDLVHSMSHLAHRKRHPDRSGHDFRHEFIEGEMVAYAVKAGWLEGGLKRPQRAKPSPVEVRRERVLARLASWEKIAKRAATAIKKLRRQARYYEARAAA